MNKEFVKRNNSRGYSGWVYIGESKFYCRSSVEFIYLYHFIGEYRKEDGYRVEMEKMIFQWGGEKYKPDFLIYKDNILVKVFEIKSDKNQAIREGKLEKYVIFKKYFNRLKIDFEICYKDSKILTSDISIKLNKWKGEIRTTKLDGENNPMFGMRHSDESKSKIGQKTSERCKNPEYIIFLKSRMIKTDSQKENIRVSAIKRHDREKLEKHGQTIIRKCIVCDSEFECREKSSKLTCKNSCTFKFRYKNGEIKNGGDGFKSYKTRIIKCLSHFSNDIKELNIDEFILFVDQLKIKGDIPKTLGVSYNTITKYFNDFEILKKELNYEDNKD